MPRYPQRQMDNRWMDKPADIQYLLDSGLLFEINRSILHLVGLALTVKRDEQGGLRFDIKDSRKEPENLTFSNDVFDKGKEKLKAFMEDFGYYQIARREKVYGAGCQSFHHRKRKQT